MKVADIVHDYADGNTRLSRGMCRMRAYVGPSGAVVILTELNKNDGTSVTNAVERIIKSILDKGLVIEPVTFIEHYERDEPRSDSFDVVTLSGASPRWRAIGRSELLQLIDCPPSELDERSGKNRRISSEADRIRYARNPFVDSVYSGSNEEIKRRIEIVDGMVSKSEVASLISSGASEREIQKMLKSDMSIFGEAYAKPDDEYICFSEFPLDGGFIDFAVFSGRSRMDVILIEVKGADFNLLNSDHYKEFNHKIGEAVGQIRSRLGYVYRNADQFRKHVHSIRKRAQRGGLNNSFLGPMHKLEVDPNKDINIRTVVIGGRTVNDLEESVKRHEFERSFVPPIRIESWDTWLRRLKRS